jgi:hypothetical protein
MEDGRWKMEDGRWEMEDGSWNLGFINLEFIKHAYRAFKRQIIFQHR